eukprot:TRINITY_DN2650_c0_g3_i1.p3 TRINITY_DN2650_c0_g3~~TRINITY_DN2650_c0_g3_i1.p3  ORF type:complete len:101 (+),score=2.75 TRINITY_DN2650_c0_g3_i1:548-850(+)
MKQSVWGTDLSNEGRHQKYLSATILVDPIMQIYHSKIPLLLTNKTMATTSQTKQANSLFKNNLKNMLTQKCTKQKFLLHLLLQYVVSIHQSFVFLKNMKI